MSDLYYSATYESLQDGWSDCMAQESFDVTGFADVQLAIEPQALTTKTQSMTAADREAAWNNLSNEFNAMSAADSRCRSSVGVTSYYQNTVMPAWNSIVQGHITDAYTAIGAAGLAKQVSGGGY